MAETAGDCAVPPETTVEEETTAVTSTDPEPTAAAEEAKVAEGPTTNEQDQKEAAELRAKGEATEATALDPVLANFDSVYLDEGAHKYVLIRASARTGPPKYLVRSKRGADYHRDAARPCQEELHMHGLRAEVLGGGRIDFSVSQKRIKIYGFSYGFPWREGAGHSISADLCREAYPGYDVTWTDDGY